MKAKVTLLCALCATMLAVAGFTFQASPGGAVTHDGHASNELPKVRSRVPDVSLEGLRSDDVFVFYDIVNNSQKPIVNVTVRSGNSSITHNAFSDEVFILPGMKVAEKFMLEKIRKGTLTITAVEFIDGELVGTDYDKEYLRDMRKKQREGKAPKALKSMPAVRTWVGGQN